MSEKHLPFVDWMKAAGIALIVYGHVSATADHLIPPIYPKQLGVAFFLFSTGFMLARETRPGREVLFKRLFDVYFFGIAFALIMSAIIYALKADLNESNYLPFLLGINVVFNDFPANPTTWYIGTYFHFIVLWVFALRGLRVRPWMLALSASVEIAARAGLAESAGLFVAYMAVPNWMTVFLLGLYYGQRVDETEGSGPLPFLGGLVALVVACRLILGPWVIDYSFPFMTLDLGPRPIGLAARSACVSIVYLSFTWVAYQAARRLPRSRSVRFIACNTLIIFLVHMPIYYVLSGPLARWTTHYGLRVAIQFAANFFGLAILSEIILRATRPKRARNWIYGRFFHAQRGLPLACNHPREAVPHREYDEPARP
jgi:fucose 4-O-acetylase-like acetyltransferase